MKQDKQYENKVTLSHRKINASELQQFRHWLGKKNLSDTFIETQIVIFFF